ncbi:MAG TPA: MerR family transcriptional regulator [Casimicrobiaceae bacterium]|nr:MerR family transcriptional regulator [Casimicrobiaceae bacterium]
MPSSGLILNISAVERETGLSKDVLRVWERRYGFPEPTRDENAERQYPPEQVAKLRIIKRLMDTGMRPGKLMRRSLVELSTLAESRSAPRREAAAPALERDVLALLTGHNPAGLQHALANALMRQGVQRFVTDTVVPLNRAVGEAWMRGELQIFEEHLYAEQVQAALRIAVNAFPRQAGAPKVLLTTFPGEQHGLGLLMLEALLVAEGAQCVSLGTQTPIDDIHKAAVAHKANVVALSFSEAFPLRQAGDGLAALRRQLPAAVALWAGGEMTRRLRKALPGVVLMPELGDALSALRGPRADPGDKTR